MTKREVGILSEWRVACDRVLRFGNTLLEHRYKTPFAEIDLVLRTPQKRVVLIEVKTMSLEYAARALTVRQRLRLQRAREFLSETYACEVILGLAIVDSAKVELRPRYFNFPES